MPLGLTLWIEKQRRSRVAEVVAADGQGDELARAGELGDAGRDEGEVLVGADPPGGDELADLLRDAAALLAQRPPRVTSERPCAAVEVEVAGVVLQRA